MPPTTVFFLHGKESGPWGPKIRALARVAEKLGCRVVSQDDQGIADPGQRVRNLVAAAGGVDGPLILVGSSMGGYVAAVASARLRPRGLFLMAPAIGLAGYEVAEPDLVAEESFIVHGWDDHLVSPEPVIRFARDKRCPLCMVADNHSLLGQLAMIEELFAGFLSRCLGDQPGSSERARLLASL